MGTAPFDMDALLAAPVRTPLRVVAPAAQVLLPTEGERIRDLPSVDYTAESYVQEALAWARARWWRGADSPMDFRPLQAAALYVAHQTGGALLDMPVGSGKTLVSLLLADALGARVPLLLIPPALRFQLDTDLRTYNRSFVLPRHLRIMAYSQLSVAASTDVLDRMQPDLLILDEAHNLRHDAAARTKRVTRYQKKYPGVRVVAMSGTITGKSLRDYHHIAAWALKKGSPVPREYPVLESFCAVLDARPTRATEDARYAAEARPADWHAFRPLFPDHEAYEGEERVRKARAAWARRYGSTPGIVRTETQGARASLVFRIRPLAVPGVVTDALAELEKTWRRPDGEELMLALDKWRVGICLSQGFYYRWRWATPDGTPSESDKEWLVARAFWHREVRRIVGYNRVHLDSPLLVTQALRAGRLTDTTAAAALAGWEAVADRYDPTPPIETVWLSDFLVGDVLRWMQDTPRGLVWYDNRAVEDALAARGVPVYGAGSAAPQDGSVGGMALSVRVNKEGKNFQYAHSENLVLCFPSSGAVAEQLVGRTHREGQEADEVTVDIYGYTEPLAHAIAESKARASYIQESTRSPQKILYGTWLTGEPTT